ncbi:agmatinase [candidate division KSB1 bacterium]
MTANESIFYQPEALPVEADCILWGLPWDNTVTGRPGARFGPHAIRRATLQTEDFSPYSRHDISDIKIHDAGDVDLPFGDTGKSLGLIYAEASALLQYDKPLITLGGEHLITYPLIQAFYEKYADNLFVIQCDAHADLRTDYMDVTLSHATVMHLIHELIGISNTAAVGIRSGSQQEWAILDTHPYYFGGVSGKSIEEFEPFAQENFTNRKLYITLDLDVFDPGILPGTGTPEPGGIGFKEFISLIKVLRTFDIVGADIVELAPEYDTSGISNALAAAVLRELLLTSGGKHD